MKEALLLPFALREPTDMVVSTLNVLLVSALLVGHLGMAQETTLAKEKKSLDEAARTLQVCLHVKVDRHGTIMIPQDIVDYLHEIARLRGLMGPEADGNQKRNDDDNLRLYKKEVREPWHQQPGSVGGKNLIRLYKRGIRLYKRGIRLY